jgi:hypothetical protein
MPDSRLTLGLYSTESYIPRTDGEITFYQTASFQIGRSLTMFLLVVERFCPTCFLDSASHIDFQMYYVIIGISIATVIAFLGLM